MPGVAAEAADDAVGAEILAHLADRARAIGQVDAVEAQPVDQTDMFGDDDRDVARVPDLAQDVGRAGQRVLVPRGQCQAQAGDRHRVQRRPQDVGKALVLDRGRRRQVDLRRFGQPRSVPPVGFRAS